MKYVAFFLILFVSIGANLPDGVLARLGLESGYLLAILAAVIITWLSLHRHILVLAAIIVLSIGANLPEATAQSIGYDRDILFAVMIALVILPIVNHFIGWDE